MLCKAYQKNEKISSKQNPIVSDYFLERGDYFKLDQITLGYTLPTPKARFMDQLRIYGTVRNVFTITKYSGMDPSNFQINGLTRCSRRSWILSHHASVHSRRAA